MSQIQNLLAAASHRPIALRTEKPIGQQTWANLLFAHWKVPKAAVEALLPEGMKLDTRADDPDHAWVGIVPFEMQDVRPRGLFAVWGVSRFLELNVRTYVTCQGVPGVLFLSLDAASWLGVIIAQRFFHLPYFWARMSCDVVTDDATKFRYISKRRGTRHPQASFEATYCASGPAKPAPPGSLTEWLTERYCVFSADDQGGLWRADVHHRPWVLHPATITIEHNDLTAAGGIKVSSQPDLVHFAPRTEVLVWWPKRIGKPPSLLPS